MAPYCLKTGASMDWVDTAKNVHLKVLDKWFAQPIVFHHVPKCGGTSVARALRRRYFLSQTGMPRPAVFSAMRSLYGDNCDRHEIWRHVCRFREELLIYHMTQRTRCIAAHVIFSEKAYDLFAQDYKFLTVVREPVSRFLSHYYHAKDAEQLPPLEEFIKTPRARYFGSRYVEYFCGIWGGDLYSDSLVERACKNIQRFSVVGEMEHMRRLSSQINQATGVSLSIGHENRGGYTPVELPAATLAGVRKVCAPDLEVYASARNVGLILG